MQLKAVGDQSVNQAVKAVAIARSYLQEEGMDICLQVCRLALPWIRYAWAGYSLMASK